MIPHRALHLITLAGLALGATATPAAAATKKPVGPALAVYDRTCKSGADAEDRYLSFTTSTVVPADAERVAIRFTVRERSSGKRGTWRRVTTDDPSLGTWTTNADGTSGFRWTKTISLPEGETYKVRVESRGVDAGGDAVTRTTRQEIVCKQQQYSPRLVFGKVIARRSGRVTAVIENAGRSDSEPGAITFAGWSPARDDEAPTLSTPVPALEPGQTTVIRFEIPRCGIKVGTTQETQPAADQPDAATGPATAFGVTPIAATTTDEKNDTEQVDPDAEVGADPDDVIRIACTARAGKRWPVRG